MLRIITPINLKLAQLFKFSCIRVYIVATGIFIFAVTVGVCLFIMPVHAASNLAPGTAADNFVTTWNTDPDGVGDTSVTIPTNATETYNYDIDWDNDGVFEQTGVTSGVTHDFGATGEYTVRIRGTFPQVHFSSSPQLNRSKILSIDQWGTGVWSSMAGAFEGTSNLTLNAVDAPNLTNVTDVSDMFKQATLMNSDLSAWDMGHVVNMSGMFTEAANFNGNISTWNTSSLENASRMFAGATNFNSNISNWNVANLENALDMFASATSFNQDLSQWNTANVTNMRSIFYRASSFNGDVSTWNTANVTDMNQSFSSATSFNRDISGWNTENVTTMYAMFNGATAFNQDLSQWNTANVTTIYSMFGGATSFNGNVSTWDTGNITDMFGVFSQATAFNRSLSAWNISQVNTMSFMLSNTGLSVENYDATLTGWASRPVPSGIALGATALQYCHATADRQKLIDDSHWTITGDKTSCPLPKQINSVAFSEGEGGEKLLTVTGLRLVNADGDPTEYIEALSRSLVSLNGTPLKSCTFAGMDVAQIIAVLGVAYPNVGENVTDDQPCYYSFGPSYTPAITETQALVWLPPAFDTAAQGTVSVNGSPVYTFNQQTTPGVDEPTAIVENKPLTGVPVIPKRPHFSGTAEPGATVTVTVHSDPISCTALADSNGNWACQLPSDLEPGQHTVNIHIVLPGGGTQDLGPYTVTVNPDGTSTPITNTTPLAPNTGFAQTVKTLTTQPQGLILLATLLAALGVGGMVARERRRS